MLVLSLWGNLGKLLLSYISKIQSVTSCWGGCGEKRGWLWAQLLKSLRFSWMSMSKAPTALRRKVQRISKRFPKIKLAFQSTLEHTWYLSFFLHGQHFGHTLSPHRKCVNCDKTGFATKQRKLQQNRFCKKTVEKRSHIKIILSIYSTWYARANNSWNQTNFSTSKMSPHVKFLHI